MASRVSLNRRPKGKVWLGLAIVLTAGGAVFAGLTYYVLGALSGGSISVESEPSGASVLVNGHVAGATPISIKGLPGGTYDVRLEKAEFAPMSLRVDLSSSGSSRVHEKLSPVAKGILVVNVKPPDSEVLLDGELIGHTPLKVEGVEAGPHELMVRKTNFTSYSRRVEIESGQTCKFDDIELGDKILELLENKVKSEPQRVGHYIDLAHYYFVNDRMDEAVDTFVRGDDASRTTLDFDGPGYPGKDKMSPEEIEMEQRLRREDQSRFPKELDKHRSFPRKDTRAFRMKLTEAFDANNRKDLKSWSHAKTAAQEKITSRNYDQAAKIYKDHIAAAPMSTDLPKAYLGLIEVLCMQGDVDGVTGEFIKFFVLFDKKDGASLRNCGNIINQYYDRPKTKTDRDRLLKVSEKALRAGLDLPCDNDYKSQALFDLGLTLFYQERMAEAVTVLRQSVALTRAPSTQEDRQLRLAEALRKAGDHTGAIELYKKLKTSERPNVRETANYGMIAIEQNDTKQ